MNELQTFNFNAHDVRTIMIDDNPWFVVADIGNILESSKPSTLVQMVDDEDKGVSKISTLGGEQKMLIVNESGLYTILLRSNNPQAKPFRRWVTSEVVPSIRKHGAYMTDQTIEQAITSPDFLIKLATELKNEKEKVQTLKATNSNLSVSNEIMRPKADYFDDLVERNTLTGLRETAKMLGMKQNEFIAFLLEKKYIYRDKKEKLMPRAQYNGKLFEIKESMNKATQWSGTQTMVTPIGRETFNLLLARD